MSDESIVTPVLVKPARQSFPDRVAARAVDIKFAQLVLSVLALPFYVLGLVVGLVLLAVKWCYVAVLVGYSDVTKRGADAG